MEPLYITAAAVTVIQIALILWRVIARRHSRPRLPFSKPPSLLTPAEPRFYRVLLQAVPKGMMAFVKVRLLDVVNVPEKAWREYGAPASGMHLAFVLADSATMEVRLVIELDDRSQPYGRVGSPKRRAKPLP